jgi:hypothetical protein
MTYSITHAQKKLGSSSITSLQMEMISLKTNKKITKSLTKVEGPLCFIVKIGIFRFNGLYIVMSFIYSNILLCTNNSRISTFVLFVSY